MRNIKDFQARYDRWKNGERYWDIRGVDLPRYDTGNKNTVVTDDGSIFNVDPSAIGARNLEITTPEVEVVSQKPIYLKKREQLLNNTTYNPGEIRQGKKPSALDNIRTLLSDYRDNPIARNVEQSIEDWQHHKTPMQAAFDNFAYMNPYTATIAAGSNLLSDRGIRRTVNLAKNGQYDSAALSGLGDLLDASMFTYGGRHIKNNGMFDVAKLFRNTGLGNYLQNKIISNQLSRNIKNWDGTVGMEYFNSPNNWYRWTETPEIEGIKEVGKNVTTRDAVDIEIPSNNWRIAAMDNYSKSKEGYWYKADKPDEDMPLREWLNYLKNNANKPIGSGKKYGSAHGNKSQAAYGKAWDGSLSNSGIGQLGLLEGQAGILIPFGKTRTSFTLTPIEEVPIGGRIGFSTGEMPLDNLGWFTKLPNGRFRYLGEVLPYKRIEIPQKLGNGRYLFDSPTYLIYTGPKHDISEIINTDGSVNLRNLSNVQNEALRNIPGGTIARHRLENQKLHPTDWNTFLHTRDVYKRALENKYPQEALFPALMHDFGKMWAGDGHGPYGASIIQLIFPKASKEQILAIYGHMDTNPVAPLTRLVKGVDIKEPNEFRYLLKSLNHHLLGEDAVKMFKEYGGTPIPEGSINGDLLRRYVMEARERYGLMNNTDISDEEIAQALYKHTNELGKGSAAINSQGEPLLLFRGDTKVYTLLKSHKLDSSHLDMDNEIGTLFTGEFPGTYGDQFDAVGSSRYLDGWSFNPTTNEWNWRAGGTGSNANKQEGYLMFFHIDPRPKLTDRGWVAGFKKASSTPEHPNDLNAFIVRTPAVRDASREISVMNEPYLILLPSLKTKRFKYDTSKGRIVDTHNKIDDVLKNKHYVGMKYAIKEHYTNVLKDALKNNLGLLKSSRVGENGVTIDNTLRDEHPLYSYFVLPDFNKLNAKHILPYDLRIPRNWSDPNIFRIIAPIGMSLPFLNNFRNKVNYEKER